MPAVATESPAKLPQFVIDRLSAAAEEILGVFLTTIAEDQEELQR